MASGLDRSRGLPGDAPAPEGRFLQVNRSLCRIVGYDEDELLASTFQEITHLDADVRQTAGRRSRRSITPAMT